MKKLKFILSAIIPVLLFTSKVNALSIEMYQDQQMTALGYKECILAKCWDRYRNVKYDGQLASLNFYSPLTISPLEKYTLTINFRGDDFISAKANTVSVNNNTECSIISTQTDGNEYSTYLKIAFVCGQASDWFHVNVGGVGDEDYITGGPSSGTTTYGITSLDIVNETAKDTEKIIAGNDKNTDNIINNNDKNTNTIIDKNKENTDKILDSNKNTQNVIKDQFNTCRDSYNILDYINNLRTSVAGLTSVLNKDGSITTRGKPTSNYIGIIETTITNLLEDGELYTLSQSSPNSKLYGQIVARKADGTYTYFGSPNGSVSITVDKSIYVSYAVRIQTTSLTNWGNDDLTITNKYMLVKGTYTADTSFDPYGQQICSNKLDEQTKTSKNIWETIKSFPSTFSKFFTDLADKIGKFFDNLLTGILNGIKSLFVPDDFSFIDDFKTTLENKLGFIASIPIQLLDYLLSLKNKALNPMNKITFPKISIFGYYFWDNMEIDITKGLGWISSFKYLTDLGCVIIVVNTLRKWYVNFTGGDEK